MAAKKAGRGKLAVCEGQLLEGRTDRTPRVHWATGTKQYSGVTVELPPLSSQRGLHYIVKKIEELGKTVCPPTESWGAPGHRGYCPWKQTGWLEGRCGGRKLTTMGCRHEGLVPLSRPSGTTALSPQWGGCSQGATGTTRQPGTFSC